MSTLAASFAKQPQYSGLTAQQSKLLHFLKAALADSDIAPSYQEMCDYMGLASKSGIARLLDGLEQRGRIYRPYHKARSISILDDPALSQATAEQLLAEIRSRGLAHRLPNHQHSGAPA